jgi:hypothetical protein
MVDYGVLATLKLMLSSTNTSCDEQASALTCLWHLCFDPGVAETVRKDPELITLVANTARTYKTLDPALARKSHGIMFTLNELPLLQQKQMNSKSSQNKQPQVYLSCSNGNNRDTCVRIRDELKARGYGVTGTDLDITPPHQWANLLVDCVEQASFFVICASERYYQSAASRVEVETAIKLGKPIVCAVVQKDYEPSVGWLKIAVVGKMFYKFANASGQMDESSMFEHTFGNMMRECGRHMLGSQGTRNSHHNKNEEMADNVKAGKVNFGQRGGAGRPPPPPLLITNYGTTTNTYSNNTMNDMGVVGSGGSNGLPPPPPGVASGMSRAGLSFAPPSGVMMMMGGERSSQQQQRLSVQYEIVERKCKCFFVC